MGSSKTDKSVGGSAEIGYIVAVINQLDVEVVVIVVGKRNQGWGERGLGGDAVVEFEG